MNERKTIAPAGLRQSLLAIASCCVLGCSQTSSSPAPITLTDAAQDSTSDADTSTSVDVATCAPFSVRGPRNVGVKTVMVGAVPVEVWYPSKRPTSQTRDAYDIRAWLPADERNKIPDDETPLFSYDAYRDAALADGAFPLVLFSHGFGGYRMQSSTLTSHLASWGFVVAAPDHFERNLEAVLTGDAPSGDSVATLRDVRDWLVGAESEFSPMISPGFVGVVGHSAGGATATRSDFADAIVSWATPAGGNADRVSVPALIGGGELDRLAPPAGVRDLYLQQDGAKRYISVANSGHLAFSDICLIGRDQGGILELAASWGVRVPTVLNVIGSDGCAPPNVPPEDVWPLIHEATAAFLTHAARRGSAGSDAYPECFPEALADMEEVGW